MNKADVIESLTARLGDKKVAAHAVDGFIDIIERAVAKGEKVSISGFGTFETAARPGRMGRNPRTGEKVRIKKTTVAKFRPGTALKSVASGETKKGREPKHTPLLPEGVTRLVSVLDDSAPAATTRATRTPRKTAASTTNTTGAKASPARKTASTSTARKTAPAKKTAANKTSAATTTTTATTAKKTAGAKASPARKTATSAAKKTAPAAKKTTTRKTKATASK